MLLASKEDFSILALVLSRKFSYISALTPCIAPTPTSSQTKVLTSALDLAHSFTLPGNITTLKSKIF